MKKTTEVNKRIKPKEKNSKTIYFLKVDWNCRLDYLNSFIQLWFDHRKQHKTLPLMPNEEEIMIIKIHRPKIHKLITIYYCCEIVSTRNL